MNKLNIALKKQKREIQRLKKCMIFSFYGFGKSNILVFDSLPNKSEEGHYPDPSITQTDIDNGEYESLTAFDAKHTADIEFEDIYTGSGVEKYRQKTKSNLIDLGKSWRERVTKEFPEADLTIVVHKQEDEWFLDTFNYNVEIEDGICL
ncbi:MAG: hypothetical protein GY795_33400 [Desulfobacterales bacterium]|nr:hypothetical protein [Desulfobacterales bacterium]